MFVIISNLHGHAYRTTTATSRGKWTIFLKEADRFCIGPCYGGTSVDDVLPIIILESLHVRPSEANLFWLSYGRTKAGVPAAELTASLKELFGAIIEYPKSDFYEQNR